MKIHKLAAQFRSMFGIIETMAFHLSTPWVQLGPWFSVYLQSEYYSDHGFPKSTVTDSCYSTHGFNSAGKSSLDCHSISVRHSNHLLLHYILVLVVVYPSKCLCLQNFFVACQIATAFLMSSTFTPLFGTFWFLRNIYAIVFHPKPFRLAYQIGTTFSSPQIAPLSFCTTLWCLGRILPNALVA